MRLRKNAKKTKKMQKIRSQIKKAFLSKLLKQKITMKRLKFSTIFFIILRT